MFLVYLAQLGMGFIFISFILVQVNSFIRGENSSLFADSVDGS